MRRGVGTQWCAFPSTDADQDRRRRPVLLIGGLLFALGFVVYAWLTGDFAQPPYLIVSFLVILLLKFPILGWAREWIEKRANVRGLSFALILFSLLLTAHVASVLHFLWQFPEDFPWWPLLLLLFLGVGWAWPLSWGIAACVRKLRGLSAVRQAEPE
jgi:UDP-N-acetylmuramyl pentapeptide phosphotransferase/UDP-N-acetylglucosamine-1-phosphate transferase